MGCNHSTAIAGHEDARSDAPPKEVDVDDGYKQPRRSSADFHKTYQLGDKIGQGSFGRVYACDKTTVSGPYELAVKVLDMNSFEDDSTKNEAVKTSEKEAEMLKMVANHKNVCALVTHMTGSRFHYMIMENCELTLLQRLQAMSELTERELGQVVHQMVSGVASVHAAQVVHRDIKPDNFLCAGPDATVKLCDFGMAEVLPAGSKGLKKVMGTPPFMSPEMVSGSGYDTSTDVWSLGVSLYAMLIGEFPYIPEKPDPMLMIAAIRSGLPEPRYRPTVPDVVISSEASALVHALLSRKVSDRLTASNALEHSWFSLGECQTPEWKPVCLKKVIRSAKHQGAFSPPTSVKKLAEDTVDAALQDLQQRHRRISVDGDAHRRAFTSGTALQGDFIAMAMAVDFEGSEDGDWESAENQASAEYQ